MTADCERGKVQPIFHSQSILCMLCCIYLVLEQKVMSSYHLSFLLRQTLEPVLSNRFTVKHHRCMSNAIFSNLLLNIVVVSNQIIYLMFSNLLYFKITFFPPLINGFNCQNLWKSCLYHMIFIKT